MLASSPGSRNSTPVFNFESQGMKLHVGTADFTCVGPFP